MSSFASPGINIALAAALAASICCSVSRPACAAGAQTAPQQDCVLYWTGNRFKIVRRAAAILSSTTVWNRADNRECPKNAQTWSIYCAMVEATIQITGGFQHRRPALEVVREIVEERAATRNYQHRLMDYNNDPTTRLSDVQSLFAEALARMNDATWLRTHGFVGAAARRNVAGRRVCCQMITPSRAG
jgi:hypothetical protein